MTTHSQRTLTDDPWLQILERINCNQPFKALVSLNRKLYFEEETPPKSLLETLFNRLAPIVDLSNQMENPEKSSSLAMLALTFILALRQKDEMSEHYKQLSKCIQSRLPPLLKVVQQHCHSSNSHLNTSAQYLICAASVHPQLTAAHKLACLTHVTKSTNMFPKDSPESIAKSFSLSFKHILQTSVAVWMPAVCLGVSIMYLFMVVKENAPVLKTISAFIAGIISIGLIYQRTDLADRALHMLQAVLTDGTMAALIDHICKSDWTIIDSNQESKDCDTTRVMETPKESSGNAPVEGPTDMPITNVPKSCDKPPSKQTPDEEKSQSPGSSDESDWEHISMSEVADN